MKEILFHVPWWLPILILASGVAVLYAGNNRMKRSLLGLGIGIVLLGAAWALISYLVDTDTEKAVLRSYALVAAVEKQDWPAMSALLDPQVDCLFYHDRKQLITATQKAAEIFGLKSARITSADARQISSLITVNITVSSDFSTGGFQSTPSSWRLEWQPSQTQPDWLITRITLLPDPLRINEMIQSRAPRL